MYRNDTFKHIRINGLIIMDSNVNNELNCTSLLITLAGSSLQTIWMSKEGISENFQRTGISTNEPSKSTEITVDLFLK